MVQKMAEHGLCRYRRGIDERRGGGRRRTWFVMHERLSPRSFLPLFDLPGIA